MGLILISILLFTSIQCSSTRNQTSSTSKEVSQEKSDTITIKNDSLDYEIKIYEPGFWSWLQGQRPRDYHNQNYLENRNWRYVTQYNIRVNNAYQFDPSLYPSAIEYWMNVDYGYEVNYLLYHFFRFFEQKYDQNLLR
jgi:hypothetical protein